jgi:hypothetical protein
MIAVERVERADHVELGLDQPQLRLALADLGRVVRQRRARSLDDARRRRCRLPSQFAASCHQVVRAFGLLFLRRGAGGQQAFDGLAHESAIRRVALQDPDAGIAREDADAHR